MELTERTKEQIESRLQMQAQIMPTLVGPLVEAARLLFGSLLEGGKVLCCGNGASAALAKHFTSMMVNGLERERPGLPAVALAADTSVITGASTHSTFNDVYARQVSALGHPGDILLAISSSGDSINLLNAVKAAEERRMKVICLSADQGGAIAQLLQEGDVELRVPRPPGRTSTKCTCSLSTV